MFANLNIEIKVFSKLFVFFPVAVFILHPIFT